MVQADWDRSRQVAPLVAYLERPLHNAGSPALLLHLLLRCTLVFAILLLHSETQNRLYLLFVYSYCINFLVVNYSVGTASFDTWKCCNAERVTLLFGVTTLPGIEAGRSHAVIDN